MTNILASAKHLITRFIRQKTSVMFEGRIFPGNHIFLKFPGNQKKTSILS